MKSWLPKNTVPALSRLNPWTPKPKPLATFKAGDLAVDLGTATGLVFSEGEFGKIIVEDVLRKKQNAIMHIRTLVSRKKRLTGDLTKDELRIKYDKERNQAVSKKVLEPDNFEDDVEAVGYKAFEVWGRDPNLETKPVVTRGNVGDIAGYRSVFRHLIRTRYPEFKVRFEGPDRPRILIGIPHNANTRHMKIVRDVISNDLNATPFLVWEQVADAVGIKLKDGRTLPFKDSNSVAIADGGGGTFDFAVLNNGRVVHQQSFETAGDDLDAAIITHLSREHNLDIGFRTAIAIKEAIGSAMPGTSEEETAKHVVKGASYETQMPGETTVTRTEIRECLQPVLKAIAGDFRKYLHGLQDYGEVHGDIRENGFYLTGGTSRLSGLAEFLEAETGLLIHQVENPMTSVVDGLIRMLDDDDLLQLGMVSELLAA